MVPALAVLLVTQMSRWHAGVLLTALLGVPVVILLDAADGILARRLNSQTMFGSFVDIAVDRLVEYVFLQYLTSAGLVPLWFVAVFYGRVVLTDACRLRAFGLERVSASGILLPRPWAFLVLSKLSRSAYAVVKGVLFSVLLLRVYRGGGALSLPEFGIMLLVLAFSMLRAVPILITYAPRGTRPTSATQRGAQHAEALDIATRSARLGYSVQLASDIFIAVILVVLAWHQGGAR